MAGANVYDSGPVSEEPPVELGDFGKECLEHKERFLEHLDDDFNTAGAMGVLFDLSRKTRNLTSHSEQATDGVLWATGLIVELGKLLGLFQARPAKSEKAKQIDKKLVEELIEQRNLARDEKNFETADAIRDKLSELGVSVEDVQGKTIWHEK